MGVYLNLELTDHCNLRCPMCSQAVRQLAHGHPPGFMAWDTWRRVLQNLAGAPEDVHLCPHWLGEPTVHPEFDRMLEYAFSLNADNRLFRTFKLHTNGVLLDGDRARRLVRLAQSPQQAPDTFTTIHWSFDADSPATYRAVKGADHHAAVAANLRAFVQTREAAGARFPTAHIAFVIQEQNAHEAEAFVARWGALLSTTGRPWELSCDWPRQDRDAVYLRPLNCAQQAQADALHARVCARLGLGGDGVRLRAAESF
ncbi:MAG: radical SAM protein [Pseudomonadota bacterium]